MKVGRLRALDGLRFFAAFAVVVYHFTCRTNPAWGRATFDVFPVVGRFTAFGSMGVELFFVISGYVIMLSAQGKTFRRFALSRVVRLYPAYWAGVLLTGTLLWATRWVTPSGSWESMHLRGFLLNFTMLHPAWGVPSADGVYWTLWIELLFYGFVGLLLLTGGTSRNRMLALAVGWPVAGALLSGLGFPAVAAFLQPQYAPYFGVGICLYLVQQSGWRMSTVLALLATTAFALFEAGSYMPGWIIAWTPLAPSATGTTAAAALIIGAVAFVVLVPAVRRVDWRALSVLGALTYPLYIIHDIWGWWIISQVRKVLPVWPTLVVSIAIVIGMAAAIHYFVERPVSKFLLAWARRDAGTTAYPRRRPGRPNDRATVFPRHVRVTDPVETRPAALTGSSL